MRTFGRRAILCLCLLLAAGCVIVSENAAATPEPTSVTTPKATPAPTPEPTPIAVHGQIAENGVLRVTVSADDFERIEQIPDLVTLDVSGSDCYEAILAYAQKHPNVQVIYTVAIGDVVLLNDAETASVPSVPDPVLLSCLPALKELTVTEPMTDGEARALLAVLPDADLRYAVRCGDRIIGSDETELDFSDVSPDRCDELAACLDVLPNLGLIRLNRADGSSDWTLEEAKRLMDASPALRVDLTVKAFGVSFSLTDDVVSFSRTALRGRVEEVRALLPYLRGVGRLDMESCGIPDEEMAQLREAFPSPKIVWRVYVGSYSCRTDAIMIRFSNSLKYPMLTDRDTVALKYCNEVKYLDLGHNAIQNPSFVAYMPNLEVCIIAIRQPTDISAFANCPKLEYAELFNGSISDISALAACTELKHLNLCMNDITDITPLYGLTKLERLWISRNPIPQEQLDRFRELVPNCVVNTTASDPTLNEWRWDLSRPSQYSERYELLRKQFQYDHAVTSSVTETVPE